LVWRGGSSGGSIAAAAAAALCSPRLLSLTLSSSFASRQFEQARLRSTWRRFRMERSGMRNLIQKHHCLSMKIIPSTTLFINLGNLSMPYPLLRLTNLLPRRFRWHNEFLFYRARRYFRKRCRPIHGQEPITSGCCFSIYYVLPRFPFYFDKGDYKL